MTRPFAGTDSDTIETELTALRGELDAFRRQPKHFREVAHEAVDASVATARARLDALLAENVRRLSTSAGDPITLPGVADLWVLASVPEIAERWHAAVGRAPAGRYGPVAELSRAEYQSKRAELEQAIGAREAELERRDLEERRAEADRLLTRLDQIEVH